MPFIIWGRRNVMNTLRTGQFLCPRCQQTRNYKHQSARRFFTLYFIPIIPLENLGEFVECQTCRTAYMPSVLSLTSAVNKHFASELNVALKRVLALMVLVDGEAQESEIEAMRSVYNKNTKSDLSLEAISEELQFAKGDGRAVRYVLGTVESNLNPAAKAQIIEAAYFVGKADGELKHEELTMLYSIGSALRLTTSQVQSTIQRLQGSS